MQLKLNRMILEENFKREIIEARQITRQDKITDIFKHYEYRSFFKNKNYHHIKKVVLNKKSKNEVSIKKILSNQNQIIEASELYTKILYLKLILKEMNTIY